MMNTEMYAEELSDFIDNAIEDSMDADYADFLEDTWTDEASSEDWGYENDWYVVESALFGDC